MTQSIILIRFDPDGGQGYAGIFDSNTPDFQDEKDRACKDPGLTLIRLIHDESLPPITWAEVVKASTFAGRTRVDESLLGDHND